VTVETVLRRIERECREDMSALEGYEPHWRPDGTGPIMKGARSEARGVVDKCREIRLLCRKLRRERRISNDGGHVSDESAANRR